ncbi:MAG: hypothetical protein ACT4OS_00315 [Acidimicrobiales bacterium]
MVHWLNAAIFAVLFATAAALYFTPVAAVVGRRDLVRQIHVVSGLVLPVPLMAGLVGPWRRGLRSDLVRLARWDTTDRRWLRALLGRRTTAAQRASAGRKAGARPGGARPGGARPGGSEQGLAAAVGGRVAVARWGKFHAGQKFNAAASAGLSLVLLGTGAIMRWFSPFPLEWRTGATFVHDLSAVALAALVAGHIFKALSDTDALRSSVTGRVPAEWARRQRPRWYEEMTGAPASRPPTIPTSPDP